MSFPNEDPLESNSMEIHSEMIESVCAFSENGLIASAYPSELLIAYDWKVTSVISDPIPGNIRKHCM